MSDHIEVAGMLAQFTDGLLAAAARSIVPLLADPADRKEFHETGLRPEDEAAQADE